jgi:hypothetical protein
MKGKPEPDKPGRAFHEEEQMTPRERKDMPWLLTGFAFVIVIIIGGSVFWWH